PARGGWCNCTCAAPARGLHSSRASALAPTAAPAGVPASLQPAAPPTRGAGGRATMTDSPTARLAAELAGLKEAARRRAGRWQAIDGLAWPAGARIAVNLTVDFDAMLLRRLNNEPPMQLAKGEFGGRVGIWRLLELFRSHAVKATIFTPGRICELY